MHLFSRENQESGQAARVLDQKPQRPSIYIPPDVKGHKSDFDYLTEKPLIGLPKIFSAFALAAAVVLAGWVLKVSFIAFHIPFPGK